MREITISVNELDAGTKAVREAIDASGYGRWVTDAQCKTVAYNVGIAMAKVRVEHEERVAK